MHQQSRSYNQEHNSSRTFQSQFTFLRNSTYTPLTSAKPKQARGSASTNNKTIPTNITFQKHNPEPQVKVYYSTSPNNPNLFNKQQSYTTHNQSNAENVRTYYQQPQQIQSKINQPYSNEHQREDKENQMYGIGSSSNDYIYHDHQDKQIDWQGNAEHEIELIEERIYRIQLAEAEIFRKQQIRIEEEQSQRVIRQKQIERQIEKKKHQEEAHRREQIVSERIHKQMEHQLIAQSMEEGQKVATKGHTQLEANLFIDDTNNDITEIMVLENQGQISPSASRNDLTAQEQQTQPSTQTSPQNNTYNQQPITIIQGLPVEVPVINTQLPQIQQPSFLDQSIRGKIGHIGLILLKSKQYYQNAKDTIKSSEAYQQIQNTKQEIDKQYLQPVTKLYNQLPKAMTDAKYALNQEYSFNSRIMFVTLASIGIGAMKFGRSGGTDLMSIVRRTLVGFSVVSFIVAPQIYYPYLKESQAQMENAQVKTN